MFQKAIAIVAAVFVLSHSAHAADFELKDWGVKVSLPDRWEFLPKYSGSYAAECARAKPTRPCFRITVRDSQNISSMFFIGVHPTPSTTFQSWVRDTSIPKSIAGICPACDIETPTTGRSAVLTLGSGQKVTLIEKRAVIHTTSGGYRVARFVFAWFEHAGLWCNIEFRNKASYSDGEGPGIDHLVPEMLRGIILTQQ